MTIIRFWYPIFHCATILSFHLKSVPEHFK